MPFLSVRLSSLVTASLIGLLAAVAAPPARAMSDSERAAIEGVVHKYLVAHPEVLVEAMQALEAKQKAAKDKEGRASISANKPKLFDDPNSPVTGNLNGDITVVEFFDYQCGYCKSVLDDVNRLIKDDRGIKVVYKEFPILGPGSTVAARAALAARLQGKYVEAHNVLMAHRGRLDDATVMRLLTGIGLDEATLKADMEKPEIGAIIDANMALAQKLDIHGTPAFVFNDRLVPGAIHYDDMKRTVAEIRKK